MTETNNESTPESASETTVAADEVPATTTTQTPATQSGRSLKAAWLTAGALALVVTSGAGFAVGRATADDGRDQRPPFGRVAINLGPGHMPGGPGSRLEQRQQDGQPDQQNGQSDQQNDDNSTD